MPFPSLLELDSMQNASKILACSFVTKAVLMLQPWSFLVGMLAGPGMGRDLSWFVWDPLPE